LDLPVESSLDQILSQLTFANPPGLPRKILFWGEGAGEVSSYIAGWMAGQGMNIIVLDGANRFDPYVVSSFAKKALIPPESLLKRIRIARAFTCYQMATLVEEKLIALLRREEAISQMHKPRVILLGPITTFLDEDVLERESRLLFERMLRKMEEMATGGVSFYLFQPNPPFPKVGMSRNDCRTDTRNPRGTRGLVDSQRAFLSRRLFQISDWVWRMSLDDEGVKLILEKQLTKIADCGMRKLIPLTLSLSPQGRGWGEGRFGHLVI